MQPTIAAPAATTPPATTTHAATTTRGQPGLHGAEIAAASRPPRRRRARRFALAFALCLAVGATGAVVFPVGVAGEREARLATGRIQPITGHEDVDATEVAPPRAQGALRVMSLNLAHGRGTSFHQFLCERHEVEQNLDACAAVIRRERPHLVALQEADGPSSWSGRFDHVEHLARSARLGWHTRAEHVSGLTLAYGTALISAEELREPVARRFAMTPPTWTKGYVVATVPWPERPRVEVDIVSVHLDFARGGARRSQVGEMVEGLRARGRPLVIIGDLNCEWGEDGSPVRSLAERLGLRAYAPEADDLVTFPSLGRRLDWILVSEEIAFATHRVLDDAVSDHRAVVADLRLADEMQ